MLFVGKCCGPIKKHGLLDDDSDTEFDHLNPTDAVDGPRLAVPIASYIPESVRSYCMGCLGVNSWFYPSLAQTLSFCTCRFWCHEALVTTVDSVVQVSAWKRNLFRTCVAVFVVAIAMTLRNVFAYVGAIVGEHFFTACSQLSTLFVSLAHHSVVVSLCLQSVELAFSSISTCMYDTGVDEHRFYAMTWFVGTGALGSGPLLFILPCLFHNKLPGVHIQQTVYLKNVSIMVFGVIASVVGLGVSVYEAVTHL